LFAGSFFGEEAAGFCSGLGFCGEALGFFPGDASGGFGLHFPVVWAFGDLDVIASSFC
jgi:hypothetical protein